jgi:hypothetical protein
MDTLYTLTDSFVQDKIIDAYSSLVWTERYNQSGEFTLTIPAESAGAAYIVEGVFLSIEESVDVMMIDSVGLKNGLITAVGKTLTEHLKQRILRNTWSTAKDHWTITDIPGHVAGTIVSEMCGAGGLMAGSTVLASGANEVLTNLVVGPLAGGVSTKIAIPYGNVYDGVKLACDEDDLGFRLYPELIVGGYNLRFTTYAGLDRTSTQSTNPWVIFEAAMDSLTNVESLRSISAFVTAAYAWCSGMTAQSQMGIAYAPGTSGFTNFKRRTLMVDASDINAADYSSADLTTLLGRRAKDAIANNNFVRLTDGQLVPQNAFVYGTDYFLGDVIELRGPNSSVQKARVTEYIRSKDSTGENDYPTLSVID